MRMKLTSLVIAVTLSSAGTLTPIADSQPQTPAVEQFANILEQEVTQGNMEAANDLKELNNLTPSQKDALEKYLSTGGEIESNEIEVTTEVFQGTETGEDTSAFRTTTRTRNIWGTQKVKIGRLTLSETKVSGSYSTRNGRPVRILRHNCTVVKNIQPFTHATSKPSSKYISGNKVIFLCQVTATRKIPHPWGKYQISQRSAQQILAGDGSGRVVRNGWI